MMTGSSVVDAGVSSAEAEGAIIPTMHVKKMHRERHMLKSLRVSFIVVILSVHLSFYALRLFLCLCDDNLVVFDCQADHITVDSD